MTRAVQPSRTGIVLLKGAKPISGVSGRVTTDATPERRSPERLLGIDATRYIGVFAIILIHVFSKNDADYTVNINELPLQSCRFAVPFFFMSGGFFLGQRSIGNTALTIISIARRIAPVFIFWTLIYLAILPTAQSNVHSLKYMIIVLATGGPGFHLWFLPSFGLCMALVVLLDHYLNWRSMFAIALLLYVAGLLIGSYGGLFASSGQATATGLAIARGGPFAGTIFVLFGLWLARSGWRASIPQSISFILIGLAVHLLEAYLLGIAHMGELAGFDFLIGTLALGSGTFCLALHLPSSHVIVRTLAKLGRYTLGIYAVHLLFVHVSLAVLSPENFLAKFSISILVLICSTFLVLIVARLKPARFLLT